MSLTIVSGQRIAPPRFALYAVDGIGKTTFAASMPKPIFIFTEPGQGVLDVARFEFPDANALPGCERPASPIATSYAGVLEAIGTLYSQDHPYQTLVIDTLDAFEPLLWQHTSQKHGKADIEAFGWGKGFMYAVEEMNQILAGLDALANERGMAICLLAHAQVKRYDAPDHEPYDRYQMRLQEKLAARIAYWADALLFANYRTHIVRDADKFDKNKATARGVGQGERVLYTSELPAFHAKNRWSLPLEMPFSWQALQDGIARGVKPPVVPQPVAVPAQGV